MHFLGAICYLFENLGIGFKMKSEERKLRMSYISEIRELYKILREIPRENVIERETFKERLKNLREEYEKKYAQKHTQQSVEETRRILSILNPTWVGFWYGDNEEQSECCKVCSNEAVACTCMGEAGLD